MKALLNIYPVYVICFLICVNLHAQLVHPDYQLNVFKSGFSQPLGLDHAGDGSQRIFVVEKGGKIKIIADGTILATPFLDISAKISTGGEQGLLGLAFHPNFKQNGYFFVHYTNTSGDSQISRFSKSSANPNLADPNSEFSILTQDQPFSNHNAGAIRFGPDGYLYIGFGDGGSGGDPGNRAQNKKLLLGKMLRIDIDGGSPYSIPADNPFVSDTSTLDEIWAIGLRNPWQFSFDRLTGDLWIGDVGQDAREEINYQSASSSGGQNYGWRCYEGDITYNTTNCGPMGNYTFPVFAEKHRTTGPNSLAGGFVYRGGNKCFQGVYFCAETRADTFYTIIPTLSGWSVDRKLFPGINNVAAFGEDEAGDLYAVSLNGTIYKIVGDDQTISGTPISPGIYSIKGNILSNGNIQSGSVEFIAAENVYLNPVFEVFPGATFLVNLGCGN
ncbi:MAG: PQQ-dependent sugar dehydrogenase [Saprospiraceae bacterium]|nr:PQQ-dependent sugar dehydrogenase [Saprospiraceae bacterium]